MISIAGKRIQPLLSIMHAISQKLNNDPLSDQIVAAQESLGTDSNLPIDLSTITSLVVKLFEDIANSTDVDLTAELTNLTRELYKKEELQSSLFYTRGERAQYQQTDNLFDLMLLQLYLSENSIINLGIMYYTLSTPGFSDLVQRDTFAKIKIDIERELARLIQRAKTHELHSIFFQMPQLKMFLSKEDLASRIPDEFSIYQTLEVLLTRFAKSHPNPKVAIIVNSPADYSRKTVATLRSLGISCRTALLPHDCTDLLPPYIASLQKANTKIIITSNANLTYAISGTSPRMSVITASANDTILHMDPAINAALRAANTLAPFYPEIDQRLLAYNENARKAMTESVTTQDTSKRTREEATTSTRAPKRAMLTAFNDLETEEFPLDVGDDPDAVRGASPSRQQLSW